jgi:hypothetical protein
LPKTNPLITVAVPNGSNDNGEDDDKNNNKNKNKPSIAQNHYRQT